MPRCRAESSLPSLPSRRRRSSPPLPREAHQAGACDETCKSTCGATRPGEPVRGRRLRPRLGRHGLLRHPTLSLVPASNAKLAVAYASLHVLGPDFRIDTMVFGEGQLAGSTWNGDLVLKGFGDPTSRVGIFGPWPARSGRTGSGRSRAGSRPTSRTSTRRVGPAWRSHLLHQRVPAALGSDRRPCALPRLRDQQSGDRGGNAVPPRVACRRCRCARTSGHGRRGCDAACEQSPPLSRIVAFMNHEATTSRPSSC